MKLQESREEIVERFRLCGEISCTLYEFCNDEDDYINCTIGWDDIMDVLEITEGVYISIIGEEKPCIFQGITMDDEKLYIDFVGEKNTHCSVLFTNVENKDLKRINELLTRYVYELKNLED